MLRVLNCSPGKELRALRHELLKAHGCEVTSPPTEYAATECIRARRFNALLVCYQMAPEAADRLCREFRAHCPQGTIVAVVDERPRTPSCAPDTTVSTFDPAALVKAVCSADVLA